MHHYIFSWTSTKLKCRISCSNLADFKYNSLVYQVQLRSIFIKHINIEICLWYALPEINVFQIFIFHKVLFTGFIKNPQQLVKQVFYNRVIKGGILEYMRILQSNYSAWIRVALIVNLVSLYFKAEWQNRGIWLIKCDANLERRRRT